MIHTDIQPDNHEAILAILDKHAKTLAKQIRSGAKGIDDLPPLGRAKYDAAVDVAAFGVNHSNDTAGYFNKRRQSHEKLHIDEAYTRLAEALNHSVISYVKLTRNNVSKTLRAVEQLDSKVLHQLKQNEDEYNSFLLNAHSVMSSEPRRGKMAELKTLLQNAVNPPDVLTNKPILFEYGVNTTRRPEGITARPAPLVLMPEQRIKGIVDLPLTALPAAAGSAPIEVQSGLLIPVNQERKHVSSWEKLKTTTASYANRVSNWFRISTRAAVTSVGIAALGLVSLTSSIDKIDLSSLVFPEAPAAMTNVEGIGFGAVQPDGNQIAAVATVPETPMSELTPTPNITDVPVTSVASTAPDAMTSLVGFNPSALPGSGMDSANSAGSVPPAVDLTSIVGLSVPEVVLSSGVHLPASIAGEQPEIVPQIPSYNPDFTNLFNAVAYTLENMTFAFESPENVEFEAPDLDHSSPVTISSRGEDPNGTDIDTTAPDNLRAQVEVLYAAAGMERVPSDVEENLNQISSPDYEGVREDYAERAWTQWKLQELAANIVDDLGQIAAPLAMELFQDIVDAPFTESSFAYTGVDLVARAEADMNYIQNLYPNVTVTEEEFTIDGQKLADIRPIPRPS